MEQIVTPLNGSARRLTVLRRGGLLKLTVTWDDDTVSVAVLSMRTLLRSTTRLVEVMQTPCLPPEPRESRLLRLERTSNGKGDIMEIFFPWREGASAPVVVFTSALMRAVGLDDPRD